MNLRNYYWFFKKALSDKFCKKLIVNSKNKNKNFGKINNDKKNKLINNKKIRNSNVVWMADQWIYDEIYPFINLANKNANWNFEYDWSESCQFTIYKKNQFYDWHCDSFTEPYNNENINYNGKIRKLSVTCNLSDPNDYEGGELQFDFRNKGDGKPNIVTCKEILPKGSLVVFPSHVWHRVTPVTKGTRYSLVIWTLGYPFK